MLWQPTLFCLNMASNKIYSGSILSGYWKYTYLNSDTMFLCHLVANYEIYDQYLHLQSIWSLCYHVSLWAKIANFNYNANYSYFPLFFLFSFCLVCCKERFEDDFATEIIPVANLSRSNNRLNGFHEFPIHFVHATLIPSRRATGRKVTSVNEFER